MAIFSISHSESGKKLLTLKSPVDLSHIDTYECTSSEEISSIMTQAKVAQSEWKKTTLKERVELMHRVADVVIQQQDRIMDVVMRETGKPEQEAMAMEVFSAVDSLVFYAKYKYIRMKNKEKMRKIIHNIYAGIFRACMILGDFVQTFHG